MFWSRPVPLVLVLALVGASVVAGYVAADWLAASADRTTVSQICARIDYVNGLQQELQGEQGGKEEIGAELERLVEQCREALGSHPDEND